MQGEDPCARLSSSSSRRKPTFGSTERKTPVKKLVSEFSKVKSKTPKHSPGKEESGGSLAETVCKRELRSQETPEKARSLLETPLRASAPPKGPGSHPKEKGFVSEPDDLPYLSTTEMYLCRWHQPPPSPLREPSPKKEETVASKDGGAAGAEPAWEQPGTLIVNVGKGSQVPQGSARGAGRGAVLLAPSTVVAPGSGLSQISSPRSRQGSWLVSVGASGEAASRGWVGSVAVAQSMVTQRRGHLLSPNPALVPPRCQRWALGCARWLRAPARTEPSTSLGVAQVCSCAWPGSWR